MVVVVRGRMICAGNDAAVCFVIHKCKHNVKDKCCPTNKAAMA